MDFNDLLSIDTSVYDSGKHIIEEIFKSTLKSATEGFAKKQLSTFISWVSKKNDEYDVLSLGAEKYSSKISQKYNYIKVLGMSEPIPLTKLYVRVNILSKPKYLNSLKKEERESELNSFKSKGSSNINKIFLDYDAEELDLSIYDNQKNISLAQKY